MSHVFSNESKKIESTFSLTYQAKMRQWSQDIISETALPTEFRECKANWESKPIAPFNFGRYCSAFAKHTVSTANCADWIFSLPARSVIVRASFTLRVR